MTTTSIILLSILGAYVVGYLVSFHWMMREVMSWEICDRHSSMHGKHLTFSGCIWKPKYEVRSRNNNDIAIAYILNIFWPLTGTFLLVTGSIYFVGRFLKLLSGLIAPPSAAEKEVLAEEAERRIKKFNREHGLEEKESS